MHAKLPSKKIKENAFDSSVPERALNLKWETLKAAPMDPFRLGSFRGSRKVFLN